MARWRAALIAAVAATTACGSGGSGDSADEGSGEPVSSVELGADAIQIRASILATGDGTAMIRVHTDRGHPEWVDIRLTDGERFDASHGARRRTLERDPGFNSPQYVTTFDPSSPSDAFGLRFLRADASIIDLPLVALAPEFEIVSPDEDDRFRFDETIELAWTPAWSGGEMKITLASSCALVDGGTGSRLDFVTTDDDGSESYALSQLSRADDPNIDQRKPCRLLVRFEREVETSISPPFKTSSQIETTQRREIDSPLRF